MHETTWRVCPTCHRLYTVPAAWTRGDIYCIEDGAALVAPAEARAA